jgi:hypothetical protein
VKQGSVGSLGPPCRKEISEVPKPARLFFFSLKKVSLTAEVKGLTADAGVPAGKVTFEMIMARGTKMAGMHAGTNKLGTASLSGTMT